MGMTAQRVVVATWLLLAAVSGSACKEDERAGFAPPSPPPSKTGKTNNVLDAGSDASDLPICAPDAGPTISVGSADAAAATHADAAVDDVVVPDAPFPDWGVPNGPTVLAGFGGPCGLNLAGEIVCWKGGKTGLPAGKYRTISCMQGRCSGVYADGKGVSAGTYVLPTVHERRITDSSGNTKRVTYETNDPYSYKFDSLITDELVRIEENGKAACGLTKSGEARCWSMTPVELDSTECSSCTTWRIDGAAHDPQPTGRFLQVRPGGCAITMDGALVHLRELRPDMALDKALAGPPGKYLSIMSCTAAIKNGEPMFAGRALRSDGRIVDFYNKQVLEAEYLFGRYVSAVDTGKHVCGLREDELVECIGASLTRTLSASKYRSLAYQFGGGAYGVTAGGKFVGIVDATSPPGNFPK
jgi:hypothetical protein